MKEKERRRLRTRAAVLFWILLLIAGFLGSRLYNVQVRQNAVLAAEAGDEQQSAFPINGRRGDIVDRFGVAFATSLPAAAIYALPNQLKNPHAEAAQLAPLLGFSAADIESVLREKTAFAYLARNVPQRTADRVDKLALPGIGQSDESLGLRVEPQGHVGSTLVGFTGVDSQGLAGIEVAFDNVLKGKSGQVVEPTDNTGRPIPFGARVVKPAIVGDTVVLTIDRMLEYEAEEILRETAQRYHAEDGSAIIMRAQTGEILALANYPNFDPNKFASSPASSWADRAIADPYEPGSTFKIVTAAAALDSGKMTVDDTFPARDQIEVGDRVIHNADDGVMASGHSFENIDDIVTFSHNVGAAQIAMRVGSQTMYEYIQRFGLNEPTGVDLPGESGGIVGTPDTWYGSRLATIGFGQGVSVTALQMALVYSAVANGGLLMKPLIVHAIVGPDGKIVKWYAPHVVRRVIKPETSAALMTILRDVVRRGTGTAAQMPGFELAGKTGTAQMVVDGSYVTGAYTASFAGIIPADKPQYVIYIKLDRPQGEYYGSVVALPAFRELAGRVFWRENVVPHGRLGGINDPERAIRNAAGAPDQLGNGGRQQ